MRRLLALLALTGCAELVAPTEGTMTFRRAGQAVTVVAVHVLPDTSWLRMYREAADCTGLLARPTGIRWFVMPGPVVFPDGTHWMGAYDATSRGIFLVRGDTLSVRHEALHDLLWLDRREGGHPTPPFGRCDRGA